jgi:hypothetical protein
MPTTWNGEPITDADTQKRLEKPMRGAAKLDRIIRGKAAHAKEDREKAKVRSRDGHCRWPHPNPDLRELCARTRTEVAHLTHKGMGGDPQTIRSKAALMVRVCCHQGPGSLHSGDRKVVFLSPEKANGPCAFLERIGKTAKWKEVGRELWPGVLAK